MTDRLRGVVPIVATPFDDTGAIVPQELTREIEWLIEGGVDGVGVAIASEIFALDEAEWESVVQTVVEAASGRIPVVASVGLEDAEATAARARRAAELGASIAMAYPPRGSEPTTDELVDFYAAVGAVGIDVWVQDAPQMTRVELPLEAYRSLDDRVPAIRGYKVEEHPTPDKIRSVRSTIGDGPVVLGGAGGFTFPEELEAGSEGTMPGASMSRVFVEEWAAFGRGGLDAARAVHERAADVWGFASDRGKAFVHMEKIALVSRGIFSTDVCRFSPERLGDDERTAWLALLGD